MVRLTKILESYFIDNRETSEQGNVAFSAQRDTYLRCKGEELLGYSGPGTARHGIGPRTYKYEFTLEEKVKFTPDIVITPGLRKNKDKGREPRKEYENDEEVSVKNGDKKKEHTTFLLHATNGVHYDSNAAREKGRQCNIRQFDFVEVMYATNDHDGKTTFAAEIARIMGILRFTKKVDTQPTAGRAGEETHFLLLVAWLKDDDDKRVLRMRRSNPLRYMRYNFDYYERVKGRRRANLWLDLVTLQQILQPVCAYHDPDLAPTYDSEPLIMEKARFNVITLTQTKRCYRVYRPIIGEGDPLVVRDPARTSGDNEDHHAMEWIHDNQRSGEQLEADETEEVDDYQDDVESI